VYGLNRLGEAMNAKGTRDYYINGWEKCGKIARSYNLTALIR